MAESPLNHHEITMKPPCLLANSMNSPVFMSFHLEKTATEASPEVRSSFKIIKSP